jgi:hypothetical protein
MPENVLLAAQLMNYILITFFHFPKAELLLNQKTFNFYAHDIILLKAINNLIFQAE